jgi:hypothetical protein
VHRDEVRERAIAVREIVLRERAFPEAVEPCRAALDSFGVPVGSAAGP